MSFHDHDKPEIDERIPQRTPSLDLAQQPDFDGSHPVQSAAGFRPRDTDMSEFGRGVTMPAAAPGMVAIVATPTAGGPYELVGMPAALYGWALAPVMQGYLRDGGATGRIIAILDSSNGPVFLPVPLNFKSLWVDLKYIDSRDAVFLVYTIPAEGVV